MVVAQAAGLDVWGMFAHWTEETFQFQGSTAEAQAKHRDYYEQIQTEVEKCGIEEDIVPTWYPEGYQIKSAEYMENSSCQLVSCLFMNDDINKEFSIVIAKYIDDDQISSHVFEKDSSKVEVYHSDEKEFYLMENLGLHVAVWTTGNIYINISGSLGQEELKQLIDSIGG